MQEIERHGGEVTIRLAEEELRLLVGALNESLNGGYAIPDDEWPELVGQTPERASVLLEALGATLDR